MIFFLTGLCLQGNKGGPAIALSLIDSIEKYYKSKGIEVDFVLSVPSSQKEFVREQEWSNYYKLKIVRSANFITLLMSFYSRRSRNTLVQWIKTLNKSDILLQMSAISYVGTPSANGSLFEVVKSQRFFDLTSTLLLGKKLIAWTQSYGPLNTFWTKTICAFDLRMQSIIFCRGNDSKNEVSQLLPSSVVRSYPDIAITLKYNKEAGLGYLQKNLHVPEVNLDSICTVSLSSVLHSKSIKVRGEENTFKFYEKIIRSLGNKYKSIILVPHTHRPLRKTALECDYELSKQFLHYLDQTNSGLSLALVEEDLSCEMLKSIISNACIHVGARYHSVIASLSAGVPTISLSWHPKYKDIMRKYGCEDYVCDIFDSEPDLFDTLSSNIFLRSDRLKSLILSRHNNLLSEIETNLSEFGSMILSWQKSK